MSVTIEFLNVRHGFCNYHIQGNMHTQFKNTKYIERLFWRAIKTYYLMDFKFATNKITRVNGVDTPYLANIGYENTCMPILEDDIITS